MYIICYPIIILVLSFHIIVLYFVYHHFLTLSLHDGVLSSEVAVPVLVAGVAASVHSVLSGAEGVNVKYRVFANIL